MALAPGTRIGPYEVVGALGAGGMGEVYRARDAKLDRDVAIKVLPAALATDPDRLIRFEREARALAALNHPNIAHIHGFDDSGGVHALIMELVEGEDLATRIARGPMPVDEALAVTRQIAEALEAAHERGIIHRDLKPANIKITADNSVKILDFGLAKALAPAGESSTADAAGDAANSPTFTSLRQGFGQAGTEMGVILGTAAYMSPEQAKGKPVDRRADIWALGVVLFEMLTGRHLYEGETATETIAQVITQPPSLDRLPDSTPAGVRRILRRCLHKEPRNRFQSAGDVRVEIDELATDLPRTDDAAVGKATGRHASLWPWMLTSVVALVAAFALWRSWSGTEPVATPIRLEARIGPGDELIIDNNIDGSMTALSPDGRTLVYAASRGGIRQLFVRPLDQLEARPVSNSTGARAPFFSPDGRWVAFFALGKLKKVSLAGGVPFDVATAVDPRGGTWGPDDTIVFTPETQTGLVSVSAGGGTPAPLTQLGPGERSHRWPHFLPGKKVVLFIRQDQGAAYDDGSIEMVRLDTKERKVLVRGGTYPAFLPGGYLLYARESTVYAVPFDLDSLETRGEARAVLTGVLTSGGFGAGDGNGSGQFAVSWNGRAVYLTAGAALTASQMVIVDREGKRVYTSPDVRDYHDPRFSPDGTRLAFASSDGRGQTIFVLDIARTAITRVTFDGNVNALPIWTPDGKRLAYMSDRADSGLNVFTTRSDGGGEPVALTVGTGISLPTSFSPDGSILAVMRPGPAGNRDTELFSIETKQYLPFGETSTDELVARFSPDGRWIAYGEGADTRSNVFVRRYPGPGGRWQISSDNGGLPAWTKGGRELTWIAGRDVTTVMAADVTVEGDSIKAGQPRKLFDIKFARPSNATFFDASPDGSRFAALVPDDRAPAEKINHVTFLFDFLDEVRGKFR